MPPTNETSAAIEPAASVRRVKFHHAALLLVAVVAVFAIRARLFSRASEAAPVAETVPNLAPPANVAPVAETVVPDEPTEPPPSQMIGSWRDNYYGERTMTFAADGTGTMVIKLDAVGRAIYGEQLLFHLAWADNDGVLDMRFTGGEPKDAVATISKLWGERHEQKIELLTETELHLRSTDSQNLYKLKRVEEPAGKE